MNLVTSESSRYINKINGTLPQFLAKVEFLIHHCEHGVYIPQYQAVIAQCFDTLKKLV